MKYKVNFVQKCKCGSYSLRNFRSFDGYLEMVECYKCGSCDTKDAFSRFELVDEEINCSVCESIEFHELESFDYFSGELEVRCTKCNNLFKFI